MTVLDTHAWLWSIADPERLSPRARGVVEGSPEILVSAISAWELAMLVERGRVRLDRPVDRWIARAVSASEARIVEVDVEIALVGAGLMAAPLDPADALIAATALAFDAPVVSRDRRLADLDRLDVVW